MEEILYNGYLYNINIQKTKEVVPTSLSLVRFTMKEGSALPTYIFLSRDGCYSMERKIAQRETSNHASTVARHVEIQ